jgi:hypothetical protein
MQIEVNGTGMRCSGWWHCCRSPPLVALIHQTTDRDAVQVSPSSGRRISTPILTGPERPGSCFRVVGWHSPSDNVGRLIRASPARPGGCGWPGRNCSLGRDGPRGGVVLGRGRLREP